MKNLFGKKTVAEQVEDLKSYGTTIKEAGFNSVWGAFIEDFYENGLDTAKRKVSILTKQASEGPFIEGQNQAIDFISNVSGLDNTKTVKENWEMKNMNSFEMGKIAAYNDLVELAEAGATVSEVIGEIRGTLDLDLEKNASEEDYSYRLGVETACYDFLKEAGNVYGEYEVEAGQDELVMEEIFEKIAKNLVHVGPGKDYSGENVANQVHTAAQNFLKMRKSPQGGVSSRSDSRSKTKVMGAIKDALKQHGSAAGMGVAGGLGLAGAGAGAYALKKRHDKKKEQEKTASDFAVEQAMQILIDAGYEIEG